MSGFIVMPRGWMDNPIFGSVKRAPFSRRDAWAWLVENVAYQPTVAQIAGKEVELQRGQISTSLLHLGGVWGWNTMKVSRFISAIGSANMAVIHTDKAGTIITVCNYDDFNAATYIGEIPKKSHRDTRCDATVTVLKEVKTSPNGEVSTNARGSRLPRDFEVPLDWIDDGAMARVKANLPPLDLATEALKFVNHFTSKAGAAGVKLDWRKTWLNWCLNANAKGMPHGRSAERRSAADNIIEGFGRAAGLRPADSGVDCAPSGPLLGGEHARFDA